MSTDLYLVIGITLGLLAIPSLLGAYSEGRAPRLGSIMMLVAAALVVVAISRKPGGYQIVDIPAAFVRVFNGFGS